MAESSSGATDNEAGELWVCINPRCDLQMPLDIGKRFKYCPTCATDQTQTQTNADVNLPPSGLFTVASSESLKIEQAEQEPSGPSDKTSTAPPEDGRLNSTEITENREIEPPRKVSGNKSQIVPSQASIDLDRSDPPQGDSHQAPGVKDESNQSQGDPLQVPGDTHETDQPKGDPPQLPGGTHETDQPQGDPPQLPGVTPEPNQPQGDPPQLPAVTPEPNQPQGDPPQLPGVTPEPNQSQGDPPQLPGVTPEPNQPQGDPPQIPGVTPEPNQPQGDPPQLPGVTPESNQPQGDPPQIPGVTPEPNQPQGDPPQIPGVTPEPNQPQGDPPQLPGVTPEPNRDPPQITRVTPEPNQPQGDPPQLPGVTPEPNQSQGDPPQIPGVTPEPNQTPTPTEQGPTVDSELGEIPTPNQPTQEQGSGQESDKVDEGSPVDATKPVKITSPETRTKESSSTPLQSATSRSQEEASDSASEYESAEEASPPTQKKVARGGACGPPCQYDECKKLLLTPEAIRCDACGRVQRGRVSSSHPPTHEKDQPRDVNNNTLLPTVNKFIHAERTPQKYQKVFGPATNPNDISPLSTTTTPLGDSEGNLTKNGKESLSSNQQDAQLKVEHAYRKEGQPPELFNPKPPQAKGKRDRSRKGRDNVPESTGATDHLLNTDKRLQLAVPKGFQAPDHESVKVTFHVIVPLQYWEWDSTSKICIQFGHPELGEWKYLCGLGDFKEREIEADLFEMTCTLNIKTSILEHAIPYKYLILSPKTRQDIRSWYEVLPTQRRAIINRALCVYEKRSMASEGQYHQYDTFAYPGNATVSKSWFEQKTESAKATLRSWFRISKETPQHLELKPLDTLEMMQKTLTIYLDQYKRVLCMKESSVSRQSPVTKMSIVSNIQHIYESLRNCKMIYKDSHHMCDLSFDKPAFTKTIKDWIRSIVTELQSMPHSERQLASALGVTSLISRLGIPFFHIEDVCLPLLNLLILQPDIDTVPMKCSEFDYLCTVFPTNDERDEVAGAVRKLLSPIKKMKNPQSFDWLFGLPLHNLLARTSSMFDDITLMMPEQLDTRLSEITKLFHLLEIRNATFNTGLQLLSSYYRDLEPLLILDPLLLQVLAYICPIAELGALFSYIPPNVSMVWLSSMTSSLIYPCDLKSAEDWITWMDIIAGEMLKRKHLKEAELFVLLESSVMLFRRYTVRFSSPTDHCIKLVKAALDLALKATAHFEKCCPDLDGFQKKASKEKVYKDLDRYFRLWICADSVIGKEMFGGCLHRYRHSQLMKGASEMKIWKALLTVECPLPSIKNAWLKLNKVLLTERVEAVPENLKLDLLLMMEDNVEEHEILTSVVIDAAVQAVDSVLLKPSDHARRRFDQLSQHQSQLVGRVLGTMVAKKYPNLEGPQDVTLDELLEWYLWPNFLQIYGCDSKLKEGLPEECNVACVLALSRFDDVCRTLQNGDMTVFNLRKIDNNEQQMKRLCEAVTKFAKGEQMTYDTLRSTLLRRLQEFTSFKHCKAMYLSICNWVPSPESVRGLVELKRDLEREYDDQKIRDLCVEESGKVEMKCFTAARPLDDFAPHFSIMMTTKRSNLFIRLLERRLRQVINSSTDLTIASISTLVWKPTFEHCQVLIDSLINLTIKLADVDKHFGDFKGQIETQVANLASGMWECLQSAPNQGKLQYALDRVRKYWKLCEYRDGADVFLELKEVLNLHGDFKGVEKFSTEFAESMKDQTLAVIDNSLIDTGQFLEDIANSPQKQACLDTFVHSQNVVHWLKTTTKDVGDIQNFVTVALATAAGGEGDLVHDKLSHLRTIGSGFASLIYNISDQDGYKQLEVKCKSLWKALKTNPNLPKLLADCNKDLSWYQSVKDTQGSVETTSYGQMRNILKCGCYSVGTSGRVAVQSVHDLISMRLEERDKKLIKKIYTLDELRDLESKLVLICGNKEESRTEVDHFLNLLHNVTRIAEVFLSLQQAGNVEHSGSILTFPCAQYSGGEKSPVFNERDGKQLVELLQNHAKQMEEALKDWQAEIQVARTQYYQLNYYTTLQLLTLRREFGRYKISYSCGVPPKVLALLHSVSPQITNSTVRDAVVRATTDVQPFLTKDLMDETLPLTEIPLAENINVPLELAPSNGLKPNDFVSQGDHIQPTLSKLSSTNTKSVQKAPLKMTRYPSLTVSDLNDEQAQILTNCVESLGYSKSHVLRAFQECGAETKKYDIVTWCDSNDDDYSDDDREGEYESEDEEDVQSSSSESSDESEPEEVSSKSQTSDPSASADIDPKPKQSKVSPRIESISPRIKTVIRQAIDQSHPVVLKLLDADYGLEESMEAVERFGKLGPAMDYLDRKDDSDEGGLFQASGHQPISKEERIGGSLPGSVMGTGKFEDRSTLYLTCDPDASKKHLTLDQLGRTLQILNEGSVSTISSQRKFNDTLLKSGHPNLLVTSPDLVLRTALALYVEDMKLPLPTPEEVLICNTETTTEEVILLWLRAIFDPGFVRIFCLAHAERLSYQICDTALRSLSELSQGEKGYRLVIICSKEDEEKSHIISRLHLHKRSAVPTFDNDDFKNYLVSHFVHCEGELEDHQTNLRDTKVYASAVDPNMSKVRVVSSTRSGMGKSLYIQRLTETLQALLPSNAVARVTIPIHGPTITPDMMLDFFEKHMDTDVCTIYHLDIAPSILSEVDTILFSLLILQGLTDSKGRVWRCHPKQLYAVEVTLPEALSGIQNRVTHNQTLELLELLPSVECIGPRNTMMQTETRGIGMDQKEFDGDTIQRVYQYLRRHAAGQDLDHFSFSDRVEGNVQDCLKIILAKCGIRDPSWSEIHHFTKFLNIQLNACEHSVFCNETFVGDVMSGLKGFVVKFMIRMSQDFSTPSLEGVVARENADQLVQGEAGDNDLDQYQIIVRRKWEQSSHPYIFFNQDGMSITFVGFMVTQNGDLLDPALGCVVDQAIMRPQLYTGLKQNRVNFDEDYRGWSKPAMIQKIATVMGIDYIHDPDDTYVLTIDNLIKILAIQMRFRCDIPVVIMGETGCGKTRLIKYMCDLARQGLTIRNMLIMKIHGGITDRDIAEFVARAEAVATENKAVNANVDTVVFFDEANTTDSIGLIKEIMCDRRLHGRPISKDLKFIAACNPYRRHTEEMIDKLEAAGLGFYVRETQQKLGKIPLRQLVYRVLDLPPSMRPLVYDFGQLNTGTEKDYTSQIVKDHVKNHPSLSKEHPNIIPAIARVLAESQKYMRGRNDECSFVSLRDVERAMIVFEYFYEQMATFAPLIDEKAEDELGESDDEYEDDLSDEDEIQPVASMPAQQIQHPSNIARALILAVSVCYHARLQDREAYEDLMARQFQNPINLPRGAEDFRDIIRWCQEVLLDNMKIGPNIASNAALRENVFMIAICIELRIPLFLVGKPGSSKSLAKSIIQDSMHGKDSQTELLRGFKQVHTFSYQCSQLSTPESVIDVFQQAEKFQSHQDTKQYVSVVVLDEVGLAEDSPNLPLKALHPLLEDGTEGAGKDDQQKIIERDKRVAFIGISNWALDPAKINRGVMVTRGDPGLDELKLSARGICSNEVMDPVREMLEDYFDPLSKAYKDICQKQKRPFVGQKKERQFFGLRDFYSLIKMLYWMCKRSRGHFLTGPQLEHAIKRNFGGLESNTFSPVNIFKAAIDFKDSQHWPKFSAISEEEHPGINPDCSRLGLIKTSLSTKDTTWHGENRYLLFLTENYAALEILEHYLKVGGDPAKSSSEAMVSQDDVTSQPFVLFGSSFPKDKEYTQICRNINQIKICMETGRTVILLNLENLYESLYDVLNQYYMYYGGVRYVDLGLQTHRVKCRVHENFKLILIAEKNTVYDNFPTPLINRLEKHFVLTSSVLEDWQQEVLQTFRQWILIFSDTRDARGNRFEQAHAFIGYQKDTPAAVVFQATNQLNELLRVGANMSPVWQRLQRVGVLENICPEQLMEEDEGCDVWKEAVMKLGQYLLLQTASEDALFRLQHSKLSEEEIKYVMDVYCHGQEHASIFDFLDYSINQRDYDSNTQIFMQVTTHSHLMSHEEIMEVSQAISVESVSYDLHEFDTELDFSNKIGPAFHREDGESQTFLVIIQCDSGHRNSDLIACARYRIYDEAVRAKNKNRIQNRGSGITHVLFMIRLPPQEVKSQFVGFQGDPWISVHIDDLRQTSEATVIPEQAINAKLSELFIGVIEEDQQNLPHNLLQGISRQEEDDQMSVEDYNQPHEDEPYTDEDEMEDSEEEIFHEKNTEDSSEENTVEPLHSIAPDVEHESETKCITSESVVVPSTSETLPTTSGPITSETLPTTSGPISSETLPITSESPIEDELSTHSDVSMPIHDKDVDEQQEPDQSEPPEPASMMIESNQFVFHPQHRRLHGCIQAAVSALKDPVRDRSKQRLQKLMSLIPKVPTDTLDNSSLYGLLVKLVHSALKDREKDRVDEKDWVVIEAMNARKLHNGGTFRNVLARRIDEVITPFFAEVIATIDRNCNLDLLDNPKNEEPSLSQFWLAMFALVRIDFSSIAQGKTTIQADFRCQMPFSWIVKEVVDGQLANTVTGSTQRAIYAQACESLRDTELGEVLSEVSEEDCEQFYRWYLNDFVRIVHKSKHKGHLRDMEHKLIADALNEMVRAPEFCSMNGHESLTRRVTALHLVYNNCRSEILWFGQLVLHNPGILAPLCATIHHDSMEFTLHLSAVERVLSDMESPLGKDKPADNLSRWLNDVRLSQNVISSVLSLGSQSDAAAQLRLNWQRVRGVQMFVEHVLLPHSDVDVIVKFGRRLDVRLSENSDFLKRETLEAVKAQVNNMDKKLKIDKTRKSKIRKSCHSFFMEVVSSLCFGGGQAPEPDLINMLMDTVLFEDQTRELSPYNEPKPDKTPTIRSFLLQLLLEHSPKQVMEYLDDYFKRSCHIIGGSDVDHGLCLLCIQCLEDSLVKECARLPVEHQAQHTIQAAYDSYATLQKCSRSNASVSVGYLEAVAKARYALSVVAEKLKDNQVDMDLLHIASTICTDRKVNTVDITGTADTTGPVVYLLKLLVRQFGFPCLKQVSQTHPWVIPQELKRGDEEQHGIDPFVIYQQPYVNLRDAVDTAAYAKEVENLTTVVQTHTDTVLLALALYQEVTLSRASTVPAKQLQPEAVEILNDFILNNKMLSPDMRIASRLLLANQQGGTLLQMTASPQQPLLLRTLCPIVIHTASIMLCRQKMDILQPFVNIFNNPAALASTYLPTMQEDFLTEVKKSGIAGTYYECRNGHAYLVGGPGSGGACPTPQENSTCKECGLPIGGMDKNELLEKGNKDARQEDTTNTGHDLGDVTRRQTPQGHERHLSAPAVCIVRAIMHSSFIWASCNNDHTIEALAQLVKPPVLPRDLPEFFWRHLQKDIDDLSRITARGMDECAVIVHLVLSQILTTDPPPSPTVGNAKTLHSKDARQEWERLFNVSYIERVLENLEKKMRKAMDLVAKDNKQEHDQLFYLAYERVKVDEGRLEPHLWSFRSRITVDHLRSSLMQQKKVSVKILDAFLQDEENLRATQYLPDIVKLQQFLFETFNRRLEKSKARTQTIREFLRELKNENTRNEYRERIDSLKKAWALVGQKLAHHKRLPVDAKYLLPAITGDTELQYLIPTTVDEGRCTTSLVDFLVLTHNNFIETCRSLVSSGSSSAIWREHKVPITHSHRCHLLDYEHQLQSIILSHCHYSLTVGKGQDIKYDLPALEKHILNRFIYGKPMILLDIPHVAYRKDVYTAETFLAIRQKVKPQRAIPPRVQQDIITELRTPDRLRETLDVVDIVLGFLSSGGGNPKVALKKYIESHRMRKKTFSAKAKEYCSLGHVVSLWETISVELARQLWLAGQEPFESIPKDYSRDLTVQDGFNQVTELDKCLRTFDLGLLLGSLFEFIEVHVKHSTAKEEDWALVEAMEFYRDQTGQEQLPQFSNEFPVSITVDQAVATWKHIVLYQEKLRRD